MSLGVGIACIMSVGPRFTLASETQCLAQSLARRLVTPRASLPWAPNDGTDMREFLNKPNTPQNRFAAGRAAKDECEKDERVQGASVAANFDFTQQQLNLTISIDSAVGPFQLVIGINQLGIALLNVNT